ncbi:MAG: FAD-dependent oxidoreductase [Lachnospiraceae bacterium]|nr:FAD-dependent oxidoreductase [Lachnospiraceae bacterium]
MIKVNQLKLDVYYEDNDKFMDDLKDEVANKLKLNIDSFKIVEILRYSIDARKAHPLKAVYSLVLNLKDEKKMLKGLPKKLDISPFSYGDRYEDRLKELAKNRMSDDEDKNPNFSPIIVGLGPAGMFAALALVKAGIKPIIFERGQKVEDRRESVEKFFKDGVLNPDSNVQFGEGGAGTFSDGKLNTTVKDKYARQRFILETFVNAGAPKEILFNSRPHIGTDYLFEAVKGIRQILLDNGATIYYDSKVDKLILDENQILKGVSLSNGESYMTDSVILAIGHSSRDTVKSLFDQGVRMSPKPFAVGLRVEHKREDVNLMQYGEHSSSKLPTAFYKLTHKAANGRNVFSFCMCPGGYIVNASSEEGGVVVNGMSNYDRMADNSNSAIVVSVTADDYPSSHPLAGIDYQRDLEQKAYNLAKGLIPSERYIDFKNNNEPDKEGRISPVHKGETAFANLRECLPDYVTSAIIDGLEYWNKKMPGYADDDALLSGVETRTSSPVRIDRDDDFMSNVKGLYPTGEGAGYAGGIMSAAMDGLKVAEQIIATIKE